MLPAPVAGYVRAEINMPWAGEAEGTCICTEQTAETGLPASAAQLEGKGDSFDHKPASCIHSTLTDVTIAMLDRGIEVQRS